MQEIFTAIEEIRKRLGSRLYIMGHHYESDAVIAHCDFTGDSLELARRIPDVDAEFIVFCGVTFMGETAALLARKGQKVLLPAPDADCRMALMSRASAARAVLTELKERGLDFLPLCYVNTDVPLKAVVGEFGGSVCTSANARVMMQWAFKKSEHVLFLPDMHLGRNTARDLGMNEQSWHVLELDENGIRNPDAQPLDRHLLLWPGYCPVHAAYTPDMIQALRRAHPGCRVTVHPEAAPDVTALCDLAGSTSALIKDAARFAKETDGHSLLVVGTECNLVKRLARRHMNSCTIIPLLDGEDALCPDMAKITPEKLLSSLQSIEDGTYRTVVLNDADREPAKLSLTRMLEACR